MGNTFTYATLVWLTAVVVAPVIFCSLIQIEDYKNDVLMLWLLIVFIGAVVSIPGWVIMLFITWAVNNLNIKEKRKKVIITVFLAFMTLLIYMLLGYSKHGTILLFIYFAITICSVWHYKLNHIISPKPNSNLLDQTI